MKFLLVAASRALVCSDTLGESDSRAISNSAIVPAAVVVVVTVEGQSWST